MIHPAVKPVLAEAESPKPKRQDSKGTADETTGTAYIGRFSCKKREAESQEGDARTPNTQGKAARAEAGKKKKVARGQ